MSVDTGDGEPLVVNNLQRRRARKEHKCQACKETIRRGDFYFRQFVVWDGTTDTIVRCARCEVIYNKLCDLHHDANNDTAPAWRLDCGDSFQDVFNEDPPPEIAELAFLTADEMQRRLGNG